MDYSALFEEGDRSKAMEDLQQLVAGNSSAMEGVRDLQLKCGDTVPASTLSVLVRDWDGKPDHVLVTMEAKSSD